MLHDYRVQQGYIMSPVNGKFIRKRNERLSSADKLFFEHNLGALKKRHRISELCF